MVKGDDTNKLFEAIDAKTDDAIEPLVATPFTYNNMMQNPIVKPIAEADRSIRDIDEMINKKLVDAKRERIWINQAFNDVPEYQDSSFISRIIKFGQDSQDVIKLQDIQIKNLKKCIQEIFEVVLDKYGVRVSVDENSTEADIPKDVIPENSPRGYLEKISKSSNKLISDAAKKVITIYEVDKVNEDEKVRFTLSCQAAYKEESDKEMRDVLAKLIRMEIDK